MRHFYDDRKFYWIELPENMAITRSQGPSISKCSYGFIVGQLRQVSSLTLPALISEMYVSWLYGYLPAKNLKKQIIFKALGSSKEYTPKERGILCQKPHSQELRRPKGKYLTSRQRSTWGPFRRAKSWSSIQCWAVTDTDNRVGAVKCLVWWSQ